MYKTLCAKMNSSHGNIKWKIGKWKKVKGVLELCNNGFHCSKRLIDAIIYVSPIIVSEVETRGNHLEESDKQVWAEMRVIKTWNWTKEDSVALSIYSAELCIKDYEKFYPNDDRPRKAIKAAKKWLKNSTEENRSAAGSAAWSAESAAWSAAAGSAAWSAESAARSAAAESAAESARSAAWSAAESARSAAWSAAESAARSAAAESAAWSAAKEKMLDKINEWCIKRLERCEVRYE